jgi:hypothetical protein
VSDIFTVPTWVTEANQPFDNLTQVKTIAVIEVKEDMELII